MNRIEVFVAEFVFQFTDQYRVKMALDDHLFRVNTALAHVGNVIVLGVVFFNEHNQMDIQTACLETGEKQQQVLLHPGYTDYLGNMKDFLDARC